MIPPWGSKFLFFRLGLLGVVVGWALHGGPILMKFGSQKALNRHFFLSPWGSFWYFFVEIRGVLAQNRWKCHFDHFCPFWNFFPGKNSPEKFKGGAAENPSIWDVPFPAGGGRGGPLDTVGVRFSWTSEASPPTAMGRGGPTRKIHDQLGSHSPRMGGGGVT